MTAQTLAVLVIRLIGLYSILEGVLQGLTGVAASWGKIGLVYWQTFLVTVVLPPTILVLAGVLILFFSGPLGRLLARGLEQLPVKNR
ncbi:MAG: hypothetical protein AAGJ81_07945 [Verrucomicrobiota bacterium]